MITSAELHRLAEKEGLRFDQTEKDYVILWVLKGLVHSGMTKHGWVFKGGTCLRHCYYEGYRFSEDIDFSCKPGGDNLDASLQLLNKATDKVQSESGIRLTVKEPLTIPGDFQIEIPIEYSRGGARRQGLPQVKVHLTFDEPILEKPVVCSIKSIYSDLSLFKVHSYTKKIVENCALFFSSRRNGPDQGIYMTSGICCALRVNNLDGLSYFLCFRRNAVSGMLGQNFPG